MSRHGRHRARRRPEGEANHGRAVAADSIIFKKVDVFEMAGDKEKKRDARMELDPEAKILTLVDEKEGVEKATYAVIPYDQITKIVYERSNQRRYS